MNYKKTAEKIVDELFTEWNGRIAERLVFEMPDNHINGAGWGRASICDIIVKHLKEKSKCKKKKTNVMG